ncbi:MAG: tail fiber domain-containing protein [Janthinobacterium lividum]
MTVTSTNAAIAGTPILANTAGNFYYDASGRETHVFGGDIAPDATSGRDLGLSTARWSTLYVTSINNTNAPSNSSDIRLKKDIKPTTYGLQEVLRMRPVSYRWKQDLDNVGVMLGFIAQEMDTIIPESVTKPKTDKDFYGIRYTELIPVLTKAIQEQQTEIDALKAANAKLASDNTALKAGLDSKASASTVNELQAALQAMRAEMQTLKAGGSTASAK